MSFAGSETGQLISIESARRMPRIVRAPAIGHEVTSTHIVPPSSADDDACHRRVIVAYARMSSLARPCDREEQGALFEGFDVMRHSLINRQETARAEIEAETFPSRNQIRC
jgi:hypothetical protein